MVKHYCIGLALMFTGLTAFAWVVPPLQRFSFSEPHMGTTFEIIFYASDEAAAKKAARAAFERIAELDGIMSDYRETSELMKLCEKAGGEPVKVSDELFEVLEQAQHFAARTDGAFDVTVGPIVRQWRKSRRTRQLPAPAALQKALALVGHDKLKLDPRRRTVQLLIFGMLLDLGGIAKGFAADAVLAVLRQHGITHALVAAGGDITVGEPPPDSKGWKVGIAPLKNPDGTPSQFLLLKNAAVSTSGDASQFVEIDSVRYSHIVNPKTGLGLVGRRSVTVLARTGTQADSLATSVCVLGPTRGLELIDRTDGVSALYVYEANGELVTKASRHFPVK